MPSFAPRIRVEVYIPIRYESAYQDTLVWIIEEFTELRGGCTVNENVAGFYLSQSNEVIEDRVNVVFSDFPMNWNKPPDRADVLNYCAKLQTFLLDNLCEEEILIGAYPLSHVHRENRR